MKKHILVVLWTAFCLGTQAQTDTGSFVLHKFQQAIGKETYSTTSIGNERRYAVDFAFTDRSSSVPLKARMTTTTGLEPLALWIKGKTSRMTVIDDSIHYNGRMIDIKVNDSAYSIPTNSLAFPVTGYAPVTFQMLLLQYWQQKGQPAGIPLLPSGTATIRQEGLDTIPWRGRQLILKRYTIGGLIWGKEFVWTDTYGQLAALVSIDAEADKFEAMRPVYEDLLPALLKKAAIYGVRAYPASLLMKADPTDNLALKGGNLLDVVGGKVIANAVVLISKGRIERAGSADSISIPEGYTVLHTDGKTILPGLWDMHAHFEQVEWGPAYLGTGVTTVRDCGNEFDFINAVKRAIDAGEGLGPHILKAGLIDGKGPMSLGVIQADNPAEAIAAVDRYKASGFIQIKIYSSAKPEVVKAICKEAHRLGLTVTGHIPEGMDLFQGVDSGMDMVNHIPYVARVWKKDPLPFLKAHHTVVDPTLAVYEIELRSLADSITALEPNFYTLPSPLQTLFVNAGSDPKRAALYKNTFRSWLGIVKALHDYGIPIVAGTDECLPGYSIYRELELYVQAGLTPMEALQTATITPARVMGLEATTGSVAAGKDADLILVDGNPAEDIHRIRKVNTVIKNGVVYDSRELLRLVGYNL